MAAMADHHVTLDDLVAVRLAQKAYLDQPVSIALQYTLAEITDTADTMLKTPPISG